MPGVSFALRWKGLLALSAAFAFSAMASPYNTIRANLGSKTGQYYGFELIVIIIPSSEAD
jgi:hypothetical protein